MGNPFKDAERKARKFRDKAKKTIDRTGEKVEEKVRKARDQTRTNLNHASKKVRHVTGIDPKPIFNTVLSPVNVVVRVGEGSTLTEAVAESVGDVMDGYGTLAGVAGSDVEEFVKSVVAVNAMPLIFAASLTDGTLKIIAGKQKPEDILGEPLQALIEQAYALYDDIAEPLPTTTKQSLKDVVPVAILKRARYVIDMSPTNVAGIANKLHHGSGGKTHAVTLDDIIVFAGPPVQTVDGLLLWVHELKHVDQYQRWGKDGFAGKYTRDHGAVEEEAVKASAEAKPVLDRNAAELE